LVTEQRLLAPQTEDESGWLGVTVSEVTREKAKGLRLPAERGVRVTEVEADSPAAKASLKANDVIIEFNDQRVEGTLQFRRLVREMLAGQTVQLAIWRDGRAQSVSVELGSFRAHMARGVCVSVPRDTDQEIHQRWRAPAEPAGSSSRLTLLVLKDHSISAVTDYWLEDGQLHYTTSYSGEAAVPLERVDLEMTVQLNWECGVKFALRPKPTAR